MNELLKDIERVLISKEEIAKRILELGKEISKDYEFKKPLVVGILKGAVVFFSDLIRALDIDIDIDFMSVSSYGDSTKSGELKFLKDLQVDVNGRDVIIVEDIIDTGKTLKSIKELLLSRKAKSVKIACLLDKKEERKFELEAEYKCFYIPNEFVVGYGLDYAEKYRGLQDICILKEEKYK